jgi:hypothetical protein
MLRFGRSTDVITCPVKQTNFRRVNSHFIALTGYGQARDKQ